MTSNFSKSTSKINKCFSLPSDSSTDTSQKAMDRVHNGSQPNSSDASTIGCIGTTGMTFNSSNYCFKIPHERANPKIYPASKLTTLERIPVNNLSLKSFTLDFIVQLMSSKNEPSDVSLLLVDVRSFAQYSRGYIKGAINVCIPNTLLKRNSFNLDKISNSLAEKDREIWQRWSSFSHIIVYGTESEMVLDTSPIYYLIKKFQTANASLNVGWMKDGFDTFQKCFPHLCESADETSSPARIKAMPSPSSFLSTPLTCPTPMIESMASPFFNSVRPHHEITCELGDIVAVRTPEVTRNPASELPSFLIDIAYSTNGKYIISEHFQKMDKAEQKRLQSLMITQVRNLSQPNPYSIAAGIEKGSKNRYNNIWPYEHSRVKLQNIHMNESDYINASLIRAKESLYSYIATQAPLPATFGDFWKMVWEQNTRVIVALTKEEEAGRTKCHRYWPSIHNQSISIGDYFQVKLTGESIPMDDEPTIIARRFLLIHTESQETREIFQLHFVGWPDFGIPDSPVSVLCLRDLANKLQTSYNHGPMLVHCSAGCGRTGAFCSIDTIISFYEMDRESSLTNDDIVVKVVDQFRDQRLSMVQTLRQFVFCYEVILWRMHGVPGCCEAVSNIDFDHSNGKYKLFAQTDICKRPHGLSLTSAKPGYNSNSLKLEVEPSAMSSMSTPYFTPLSTTSTFPLNDERRDSYF